MMIDGGRHRPTRSAAKYFVAEILPAKLFDIATGITPMNPRFYEEAVDSKALRKSKAA